MPDPFADVLPARKSRQRALIPAAAPSRIDADGIPIPEHWLPEKWAALPLSFRQGYAPPKEYAPAEKRPGYKAFTTDYAIAWGRAQGWKLIDRERYDARTKRNHDLMLGVDALFEGPEGLIGVQGAGRYERAPHYQRFEERGGVDRAAKLHIKVVYVEFERGDKTPKLLEWWA